MYLATIQRIARTLAATHSGRAGTLALSFYMIEPSTVDFGYKWKNFGRFQAIMGYYGTVESHLNHVT